MPNTIESNSKVSYRTVQADGINIFYREAGKPGAPVLLLLHGYPTSSHMFRELIPRLAADFHIVAPDLPGFGFTEVPESRNYRYSFDSLAKTIEVFIEQLKIEKFSLYIFDYGSPVGFRIAVAHPEKIVGIVTQNGNAYEEGLGDAWDPIRAYWSQPTQEKRDALRQFLTLEGTRWQYTHGTPADRQVAPEAYTLDQALLDRPGNHEIQLDLLLDYANNLKQYPAFQKFLREYQPKVVAIWGKNDPFFLPPGAEAFRRDVPNASITLLDTGHFALETHVDEIASKIVEQLA